MDEVAPRAGGAGRRKAMKISGFSSGPNYEPVVPRRPPPAPRDTPLVSSVVSDSGPVERGVFLDVRL